MENTSLSARIKRRNKQGFKGVGTASGWIPVYCDDYNNLITNHKIVDYLITKRIKDYNRVT